MKSKISNNNSGTIHTVVIPALQPARQPRRQNWRTRLLLKLCRRKAKILHAVVICRGFFVLKFWLQPSLQTDSESLQSDLRNLKRQLKKGRKVRIMYISTWLSWFLMYCPESPADQAAHTLQREFVSQIHALQNCFHSLRIVGY